MTGGFLLVVSDGLAVTDDGGQYTGLTGLVLVVVIGIVTALLIVNMSRRIKRLPPSFPEQSREQSGEQAPPAQGRPAQARPDQSPPGQQERPAPPREG